jgi:hypothetical protein
LIAHRERMLSKNELLEMVWPKLVVEEPPGACGEDAGEGQNAGQAPDVPVPLSSDGARPGPSSAAKSAVNHDIAPVASEQEWRNTGLQKPHLDHR